MLQQELRPDAASKEISQGATVAANMVPLLPRDALKRLAAWLEPNANVALNEACNNPSGICRLEAFPSKADSDKVLPASEQL